MTNDQFANRQLEKAFYWRSISLVLAAVVVLLLPLGYVLNSVPFYSLIKIYNATMLLLSFATIGTISLVVWYVFRGACLERGYVYAATHTALLIILTPVVFVGVMLIPMLVNSDAMRMRDCAPDERTTA